MDEGTDGMREVANAKDTTASQVSLVASRCLPLRLTLPVKRPSLQVELLASAILLEPLEPHTYQPHLKKVSR